MEPAINFRRVVTGGLRKESWSMVNRAAFRIARTEIQTANTGKRNRARAHRAGFERHIEIAIGEPFAPEFARSLAQNQNFGMGCGVVVGYGSVTGLGNDPPFMKKHGADRHFTLIRCRTGRLKRMVHGCPLRLCHHTRFAPRFISLTLLSAPYE